MVNYTDYNFYFDTYEGNMSEDDFDRLKVRASAEVCKNIFNRDIQGYEEEIQMATCSVADILFEIEKIEEKKKRLISSDSTDKVIASESVSDLSRTYANINNLTDLDKEILNQKTKIKDELRNYLLNTGLLYRGG